jgi:hypothetical protein
MGSFTIVSNWFEIALLLNIRLDDGVTYAVTGPLIRTMYSNLPNTDKGLESKFDSMIGRWRKDFWISSDKRIGRGHIGGGGLKFLSEQEEECLVKRIQMNIFANPSKKLNNVDLEREVLQFVASLKDHEHSLKEWPQSWLNNFVLRHQGKGRRSLIFTPTMQPQFPEAILTDKGHLLIIDLEALLRCRLFQENGEDIAIVGSSENRTRFDTEALQRKNKLLERNHLKTTTNNPLFQPSSDAAVLHCTVPIRRRRSKKHWLSDHAESAKKTMLDKDLILTISTQQQTLCASDENWNRMSDCVVMDLSLSFKPLVNEKDWEVKFYICEIIISSHILKFRR